MMGESPTPQQIEALIALDHLKNWPNDKGRGQEYEDLLYKVRDAIFSDWRNPAYQKREAHQ